MTRRASRLDSNHGEIVEALLGVTGVTCHSLAGVANGVPDLLVGSRGRTHLVEIKNGALPPSERSLTRDQEKWISAWRGESVKVLTSASQARAWARQIAAAPGTHVDLFSAVQTETPD